MKNIFIDENMANQRFDRFCRKYFKSYPEVSLTEIYRRIRKGDIRVNQKKAQEKTILQLGDTVLIKDFVEKQLPARTKKEKIENLPLSIIKKLIIYEDENWLVFDKPAGIPMHGGTKNTETLCMNNYLEKYVDENQDEDSTFTPSFCYRLDKDTSGVLIGAKNYQALQYLNTLIRDRKTNKEYLTVVAGEPKEHEIINLPLEKGYDKKFGKGITEVSKTGQEAKTEYTLLQQKEHPKLGKIALLSVKIYTGRMHQIRVHLAHYRYPVLGDMMYGNPMLNRKLYKDLKINRQILHCKRYSFKNLDGREIVFSTQMPEDITKTLNF